MSVVDAIRLGALRLEPVGFHGDKVAIKLEQDGPPLEGQPTVSVVTDLRDMHVIPDPGTVPQTCVPLLDIRTWESLQQVAAWLEAAQQRTAVMP